MPYLELVRTAWHSSPIAVTARVPSLLAAVQVFVPQRDHEGIGTSNLVLHPAARLSGAHLPLVIVPAMSPF